MEEEEKELQENAEEQNLEQELPEAETNESEEEMVKIQSGPIKSAVDPTDEPHKSPDIPQVPEVPEAPEPEPEIMQEVEQPKEKVTVNQLYEVILPEISEACKEFLHLNASARTASVGSNVKELADQQKKRVGNLLQALKEKEL